MHDLAAVSCPDLPVKQARQRWAAYVDSEADLQLLDGDALLHTDFNPLNILLGPDRAWIIDWAWPTRGAAFIDAACFLIRAMASGPLGIGVGWNEVEFIGLNEDFHNRGRRSEEQVRAALALDDSVLPEARRLSTRPAS